MEWNGSWRPRRHAHRFNPAPSPRGSSSLPQFVPAVPAINRHGPKSAEPLLRNSHPATPSTATATFAQPPVAPRAHAAPDPQARTAQWSTPPLSPDPAHGVDPSAGFSRIGLPRAR